MNFQINKSKSVYNIPNERKKGKSLHNVSRITTKDHEKEKKDRKEKIRKIREVDPTYLIEEDLN